MSSLNMWRTTDASPRTCPHRLLASRDNSWYPDRSACDLTVLPERRRVPTNEVPNGLSNRDVLPWIGEPPILTVDPDVPTVAGQAPAEGGARSLQGV